MLVELLNIYIEPPMANIHARGILLRTNCVFTSSGRCKCLNPTKPLWSLIIDLMMFIVTVGLLILESKPTVLKKVRTKSKYKGLIIISLRKNLWVTKNILRFIMKIKASCRKALLGNCTFWKV